MSEDPIMKRTLCAFEALFSSPALGLKSPLDGRYGPCESTARGTRNESVSGATDSPVSTEDVCERCKGSKLVTLFNTYMGDADDQPCPDCSEGGIP